MRMAHSWRALVCSLVFCLAPFAGPASAQKRGGEGEFRSPEKDPANKCRCAFYIAFIHDVQAPDEMTLLYNLNDPQVNLPALMTIQRLEQCRAIADGVEDQGRRLQPKSHGYRTLHPEIMDRGRLDPSNRIWAAGDCALIKT